MLKKLVCTKRVFGLEEKWIEVGEKIKVNTENFLEDKFYSDRTKEGCFIEFIPTVPVVVEEVKKYSKKNDEKININKIKDNE